MNENQYYWKRVFLLGSTVLVVVLCLTDMLGSGIVPKIVAVLNSISIGMLIEDWTK